MGAKKIIWIKIRPHRALWGALWGALWAILYFGLVISHQAKAEIARTTASEKNQGIEVILGLYHHDSKYLAGADGERGLDLTAEILAPPFAYRFWPQAVRARLGTSISLARKTDLFYAGFAFDVDEIIAPFFFTLGLDMAVHTGRRNANQSGFKVLGCRWIFHQNISIGATWRKNHRIMTTISHASNLKEIIDACPHNAGLTNIGLRYGYRF